MKFLKFLIVLICTAGQVVSQTPEKLPIGNSAVVETLAKATSVQIRCTAPSATSGAFEQSVGGLQGVKSTPEILAIINTIAVRLPISDPKDMISLTATIMDNLGRPLFVSSTTFQLEKIGYDPVTKKMNYVTPYYAGNLWFQLLDSEIFFAGANQAYMVHRDGTIYELNVFGDGHISIPGWMNSYGASNFTELVINGNIRYDMNTGNLLNSQLVKSGFGNIAFSNVERSFVDEDNVVTLNTAAGWGSIPNFEVNVQTNSFKIKVENYPNEWAFPVAIHIATLDDLRSGRGYKPYPYNTALKFDTVPGTTYFMKVEFQDKDINVFRPTIPSTPTVIDNSRG
jgi:hypothetical protein